jgi:hypothetical protein
LARHRSHLGLDKEDGRLNITNGVDHQPLNRRSQLPAFSAARHIDPRTIVAPFSAQEGFDAPNELPESMLGWVEHIGSMARIEKGV